MVDRLVHCYRFLGEWKEFIARTKIALREEGVISRLIEKDTSLWGAYASQVENRLGWVDSPCVMGAYVGELVQFCDEILRDGYRKVLLIGMGGASLAAKMFRCVLGVKPGYLDIHVVDTTDPDVIRSIASKYPAAENLYIVASKSGDTVETLSLFSFFYGKVVAAVGRERAGKHFVAITDPGSNLEKIARKFSFRKVFLNDPCVGGRFSALSFFGIVPVALMGFEPSVLLRQAVQTLNCELNDVPEGCATQIGSFLGGMALGSRDKATFILTEKTKGFGSWLEQLIAESTGKCGKGILPVFDETLGDPSVYGPDRFFIRLRFRDEVVDDFKLQRLVNAGFPALDIELRGPDAVGAFCQIWELGVAVAGWLLKINPFDQPDVEEAKAYAKEVMIQGKAPSSVSDPIRILLTRENVDEAVNRVLVLLSSSERRCYVSFLLYLPPDPETDRLFGEVREAIRERYCLASTINYGPQYLHSTGQLHKGGPNNGVFIHITAERTGEIPITEFEYQRGIKVSFAEIQVAQALGDFRALKNRGRRVLSFHVMDPHGSPRSILKDFCVCLAAGVRKGGTL
ncbi:MAG: hypothetical protein N2317_00915 [Syntrophales bacterium]|nr:hypothetical protein [Syntrophales bacterium]